jgi:hypothetical protein
MAVGDYLLDPSGHNWTDLLSPWSTILPEEFNLWLVNKVGDAFLVVPDGSIHVLDVGMGLFNHVADNREDFADRVADNADSWLLKYLIDDCVACGKFLHEGQCYGYKVPPMLGGKYAADNLEPTDLSVHYGMLADLYQRTTNVADDAGS